MVNLEELKGSAESVLADLESNPPSRPVFVEFSGTPKSGKSTCIDIVSHFFRRIESGSNGKFRILAPTEGASKRTPFYLKDNWVAFNTWSASYALTHILEGLHHSDKYHLAILDRGLFDALVWFEVLEIQGNITISEKQRVQDFILIWHWRDVIDSVFLFTADPTTSMNRENQDKLIEEPGRAMNLDFLNTLNRAYETVRELYAGQFKNFYYLDTSENTGSTVQSTAAQVTREILGLFPRYSG